MVQDAEDVVNESSQDHGASLARLRLFLAPHSSAKANSSNHLQHQASSGSNSTAESQDQDTVDQDHYQSHSTSEPNPSSDTKESFAPEEAAIDDDEDNLQPGQVTIPAPGAVASVSPLSQMTREFSRVKYLLQCCLPGYKVHDDVMMWDMTNPSLVVQYEQHAQGLLELDSWVAVNDLGAAMGDAHGYGFTSLNANQTGMKFTTGNLQLDLPAKKRGTRQLVLCKVAVGRSLVIQNEEEAKKQLPAGYNSFYLKQQHESGQKGEQEQVVDTSERGYYHEYILNNTHQILPQYLVRFHFSAMDSKTAGPCALCEKHSAAVLCRVCEAEICSMCDQEVHSANKLVSRHKRVPLHQKVKSSRALSSSRATRRRSSTPPVVVVNEDDGGMAGSSPSSSTVSTANSPEVQDENETATIIAKQLEEGLAGIQTTCRFHEGKHVEFYCSVCEVPVCVHCKMVGDHSVGEKGSHRLLTIADAYELSLRESLKSDPLVESRKSVIENKLYALAKSKEDVLRNREQVEAAIRLQCQQALARLEEEVHAKMSVLDGEVLEYQRQLQQIEWTEDTLDDLRSSCPAVEFLSTWNRHKAVRTEQRDFPAFAHGNGAEQIKGDLELVGRLQVVSGEQMCIATVNAVNGDGSSEGNNRISSTRANRFGHEALSSSTQRGNSFSDNDIRKKLLSMKMSFPSEFSNGTTSPTAHPKYSSATFLSPNGIQIIEQIRNELLTRSSVSKSSSTSRTATFANHAAMSPTPAAAAAKSVRYFPPPITPTRTMTTTKMDVPPTLRGLPIHPARKRASVDQQSSPVARHSRLVTDVWSTILRQEMALATPTKD